MADLCVFCGRDLTNDSRVTLKDRRISCRGCARALVSDDGIPFDEGGAIGVPVALRPSVEKVEMQNGGMQILLADGTWMRVPAFTQIRIGIGAEAAAAIVGTASIEAKITTHRGAVDAEITRAVCAEREACARLVEASSAILLRKDLARAIREHLAHIPEEAKP